MSSNAAGTAYEKRGWDPLWLAKALADPKRPTFLMGCTPPREGTTPAQAYEICQKFVDRSRAQATDGFIVYDIQDEASRNAEARPFPFRRTMDPNEFASLFPGESGKSCVLYKVPVEADEAEFDGWLSRAAIAGHRTLNLVGPASAADGCTRISLAQAAARVNAVDGLAFGCVTIAERHLKKGTEHLNILRKTDLGARWFISQAVYDAEATVRLLNDYGAECRRRGQAPRKILLTFAPVGRPKTLQFVRWLGINVPADVEARILAKTEVSKEAAVGESVLICCEILKKILSEADACGVPLGISVESVSGFREEIDVSRAAHMEPATAATLREHRLVATVCAASSSLPIPPPWASPVDMQAAFELFRRLQQIFLDSRGAPWGVRWYRWPRAGPCPTRLAPFSTLPSSPPIHVPRYRVPLASLARTGSEEALNRLPYMEASEAEQQAQPPPPVPRASASTAAEAPSALVHNLTLIAAGVGIGLLAARLASSRAL